MFRELPWHRWSEWCWPFVSIALEKSEKKKLINFRRSFFFNQLVKVDENVEVTFTLAFIIYTNLFDFICIEHKQKIRSSHQTTHFNNPPPHLVEQKGHRSDVSNLELADDRQESVNKEYR